jgi:hypothetical protein
MHTQVALSKQRQGVDSEILNIASTYAAVAQHMNIVL